MNKVITYVVDTTKFIEELELLAPSYIVVDEETGKKTWSIQTTPIVKSDNGTLAMSILEDEEMVFIESMTTIKNLGTYEELFADEDKHAIYKSVYPYDVPIVYEDEEGVEQSYMRPKKIGMFAE
jgi:hypothetical protein